MKVLIITYYWPPAGGSGVQRWLKFAKYLKAYGVEPIIYTIDNPNYPKTDDSLLKEIPKDIMVLKKSIWEPTDLLFWKKNKIDDKGISNVSKGGLLSFIRGNFFIPDPKIFWVKPSVKFLQSFLKSSEIDVIISTGPPHSMHLIAQKLHQKSKIKWIADFRDPWSDLYYNKDFNQFSFTKKRNRKLEKSVLQSSDCILTVSNTLKNEFSKIANRVEVITNGFDNEVLSLKPNFLDNEFSISYIGLLPQQSNPKTFLNVLKEICLENTAFKKDLRLNLIGDISDEVKREIENNNLIENSNFIGYVHHQKAIKYQKKAQVLLLLIPNVEKSEGILTGKLFEYLTANRPILALAPTQGDVSKVLKDTNTGEVIHFDDKVNLKTKVLELYQQYKSGKLVVKSNNIQQFHRKELTKQLATIIKSLHS
ncbi:glycosyltransferase family 4 protein [uncultured Polaribacter sp.]|uniref:glycosyltransferase family 4 protein n=1 Tax=uncultured Polaribacter sp. TaxID=174711 RepID=UPI00259B07F1|nr:glycosyltransferase family 4 protein [uncultured Polaribacter sp.]